MGYLITEIFICLLIAFLLGVMIGWLLCKILCGKTDSVNKKDAAPQKNSKKNGVEKPVRKADLTIDSKPFIDDHHDAVIDLGTAVDLDSDRYHIQTLEGIGPSTGDLLRSYGIASVGDYLRKLHSPAQREQAAKDLNILRKPLDNWASMSDLLRIDGMDHQQVELAVASGIFTVGDLAMQDAADLAQKMDEVNQSGRQLIAPESPTSDRLADWINQARALPPVVRI